MTSKFEQRLYNNYLVSTRKMVNKPFTLRKDFSKMDEKVETVLHLLAKFFEKYPHIDQQDFFCAPFKVYPDEDPKYDLTYFLSRRAIKSYSLFLKMLETEDPDSPNSLKRLQLSLAFAAKYCSENGINLGDYETFTKGTIPDYITHLKEHKITFYTLHSLKFTNNKINSETLDFIFKDFYPTFQKTKNNFYHSRKMKLFSSLAIKKLNAKIQQELLSQQR